MLVVGQETNNGRETDSIPHQFIITPVTFSLPLLVFGPTTTGWTMRLCYPAHVLVVGQEANNGMETDSIPHQFIITPVTFIQ